MQYFAFRLRVDLCVRLSISECVVMVTVVIGITGGAWKTESCHKWLLVFVLCIQMPNSIRLDLNSRPFGHLRCRTILISSSYFKHNTPPPPSAPPEGLYSPINTRSGVLELSACRYSSLFGGTAVLVWLESLDVSVLLAQDGDLVFEQNGIQSHLRMHQGHRAKPASKCVHAGLPLGEVVGIRPA